MIKEKQENVSIYGAGDNNRHGATIWLKPCTAKVMDCCHAASSVLYLKNLPLDANVKLSTLLAPRISFI